MRVSKTKGDQTTRRGSASARSELRHGGHTGRDSIVGMRAAEGRSYWPLLLAPFLVPPVRLAEPRAGGKIASWSALPPR
ncbi:hypothetical protein ACVJGD_001472 [Bradyrhizobium sp. USDA 10063]